MTTAIGGLLGFSRKYQWSPQGTVPMDCDICISFERGLRDLESDLADRTRECEAAKSESEQIETRERLEAAISELFTERQLYDHHRRSAHAMSGT
jgi:hypothetical protein